MAWQLDGIKAVVAHTRDRQQVTIGTVTFAPQPDGKTAFKLNMDHSEFTDYFLSMKEFKCLASAVEVTCHVPYPYRHPGKVSPNDLAWLEHNLLFLFKLPNEFGAKLWNGVYFKFKLTDAGLVGEPMAIDLNRTLYVSAAVVDADANATLVSRIVAGGTDAGKTPAS